MKAMLVAITAVLAPCAHAQPIGGPLSVVSSFDPSASGGLCGGSYAPLDDTVWVYACSAGTLEQYASDGTFIQSVPRPGETANDVDLDIALNGFTMGSTFVPAGSVLFLNGESGTVDIYAIDPNTGSVIDTLVTQFGTSHVVGGAHHPTRGTFFVVQDRVPASDIDNLVAEIDPVTGEVIQTFATDDDGYEINFGDLEVDPVSGNLYIVSSAESTVGVFSPEGNFLGEIALPSGVGSLSGIGLAATDGTGWVFGTGGVAWQLDGFLEDVCLPDVNGDGMVTPADFTAWINAFNNNLPECDQNGDNACTPADFTAWIANFNAGC